MSQTGEFGDRDMQRLEEAGEWLMRLNNDKLSEPEVSEWLRWCDADPQNLPVFEQLQGDWNDLDALAAAPAGAGVSPPAQAVLVRGPNGPTPLPRQSSRQIPWRMMSLAAAASLVLVAAMILAQHSSAVKAKDEVAAEHDNAVATLPDGSVLTLSAQTSVGVDFTGSQRHLSLSRGEAYFKVHHDAQHPFVVQAGEVNVTAVGTAFDVRQEDDRVIVTVEEGVVEVSDHSAQHPGGAWRAGAGYQVAYSADSGTATIASINPASVLKWRNGELAYVWEPLSIVVDDVNRYSARRIVLGDSRLAQLHFTGTVFTGSIDDWLKGIQAAYPVRIVDGPGGTIVLEPTGLIAEKSAK